MATTRLKVANQKANDDGSLIISAYGDAGEDGKQPVTGNLTLDISKLPNLLYLAARGFGLIVSGQYIRNDGSHTDPLSTSQAVFDEMVAGTWTPGRSSGPAEPSAFAEALAQLSNTPVAVVVEKMADWSKSYTATVRRDPRVAALVAKIEKERATAKEAEARAKAKGVSGSLDFGGLFSAAEPEAEEADEAAD